MPRHVLWFRSTLVTLSTFALLGGCGGGGGTTPVNVCEQGELQCSFDGSAVEACDADGSAFVTSTTCSDGSSCADFQGTIACAPESCAPNQRFCHDGDVWDCTPAGAPSRVQAECSMGQACVVDAGVAKCADVVCPPGETRCDADGAGVEECAADGSGFAPAQACPSGQICDDDAGAAQCVDGATCGRGERRCNAAGDGIEACDTNTSEFVPVESCDADETCELVNGNPFCEREIVSCTPGEKRCAPDGARVEACASTGNRYDGFGDCDAGETCGDFQGTIVCAPATCTPNDRFCFDGDVWDCSAAGAPSRVQDECAIGQACIVDAGVAQCADVSCVPGELRCSADNQGVQICADDGTRFVPRSVCGDAQECEVTDGFARCVDLLECTFGERRCTADGQQERCDASGTFVPDPCDADEVCEVSATTGNPTCVDAVSCTPGEKRCAPDGARVEICGPTGNRYNGFGSCDAGETCGDFQGTIVCAPATCTPNERFCFDGDVWDCSAAGAPSRVQDECALGEACVVGAGVSQCAAVVCVPGSTRCSSSGDGVEVCSADGTGFVASSTCAADEVCELSGAAAFCRPEAQCNTGTSRCNATADGIEQCNTAGLYSPANPCAAGTVCVESGSRASCEQPIVCQPGELRCSASGERLEVCRADGTAYSPSTPCAQTETCGIINGATTCAPATCTANVDLCAGGDIWSCGPNGTPDALLTTCAPGEACVLSGSSASCQQVVCTPGVTRCAQGDGSVEVCSADGTGFVQDTQCVGAEICVDDFNAPRCEAPTVCAPGAQRCTATGDGVETCAQDASGYLTDAACAAGEVCVDDATGARCEAPQVCAPGQTQCDANGDIVECNTTGDGYVLASACGVDLVCGVFGGAPQCIPDSCVIGRRFCFDDDVWNCNSQGQVSGVQDDCTANETCDRLSGVTQCLPRECTPGELACAGASTVEVCEANGRFATYASCPAGEACEVDGLSASCVVQPVCAQGDAQCSASGDSVELCAPDLMSYDTSELCDPGETCQLISNTPRCAPSSCSSNRRFCHEGDVWQCGSGTPNAVFDVCGQGEQCLDIAGVSQCVAIVCQPGEQRCNTAGDAVEECDAIGSGFSTVETCGGTEICSAGGGVGECVDGSVNCQTGFRYSGGQCVDIDECADGTAQCDAICQNTPGGFDCVSSVADMSSSYWQFSCPLGQQLSAPTSLEADCRCGTNQSLTGGLEPCWRPFEAYTRSPAFDFGAGPRPAEHPQVQIRGGVFDNAAREILAAVDWSSSSDPDAGFVMAFDVDTRARRVVSGRHLSGGSPTTRGSGPAFANVRDVRRGANNQLYVLQGTLTRTELLSVDPITGDRALVWERDDAAFGQCDNGRGSGSVQVRAEGFAIGAGGEFYLGFANTGALGEGIGVIEISADGASCSFVTRSGSGAQNTYANQPVGSGPAFTSGELRGYAIQGGELHALNNFDLKMYAIDLTTGARRVVSSANSTSPVGSGPQNSGGIGHRWATWDASRNAWWTTGRQGDTQVILVEPNGDRHDLYCPGGASTFPGAACIEGSLASGLSLNFGGSWLDPQDTDVVYFAHDSMGIVKYEVSTGNSLIWSL